MKVLQMAFAMSLLVLALGACAKKATPAGVKPDVWLCHEEIQKAKEKPACDAACQDHVEAVCTGKVGGVPSTGAAIDQTASSPAYGGAAQSSGKPDVWLCYDEIQKAKQMPVCDQACRDRVENICTGKVGGVEEARARNPEAYKAPISSASEDVEMEKAAAEPTNDPTEAQPEHSAEPSMNTNSKLPDGYQIPGQPAYSKAEADSEGMSQSAGDFLNFLGACFKIALENAHLFIH